MSADTDGTDGHEGTIATISTEDTDFTACGWFMIDVDRNDWSTFLAVDNGSDYVLIQTGSNGTSLELWASISGGDFASGGTSLTVGEWYFIAGVWDFSAGTWTAYLMAEGGTSVAQDLQITGLTASGTGDDFDTIRFGRWHSGEPLNGKYTNCKLIRGTALTTGQLLDEAQNLAIQTGSGSRWRFGSSSDVANGTDAEGSDDLGLDGTPTYDSDEPDELAGGTDATPTPATIAVTTTVPGPTVVAGSSVTPTPGVIAVTSAVPAPTVAAGSSATATPSTVEATCAVPGPTAATSDTATPTPATIAVTSAIPTPTVDSEVGATPTPATIAVTSTVPTPSVSSGSSATATPATVATSSTVPTPTVSTGSGATATPATIAVTSTVPSPTVAAEIAVTVTPATIAVTTAVPAPVVNIGGGVTAVAATIAVSATVPTPTVSVNRTVTPATVAVTTSVPAPVAAIGQVPTPATVEVTTAVPSVSVVASAAPTPDVIAITTTVPSIGFLGDLVEITRRAVGVFRRSPDGNLHLVPVGHGVTWGSKGHDTASSYFIYNAGTEDDIMADMDSVWAAHSGSPTGTLQSAVDARLDELGYLGVEGALV